MVKVYTRTGDDGTTHCFKAGRVSKGDVLIEAIGAVDELNSFAGSAIAGLDPERFVRELETLQQIQNRLFDVGGALATVHVPDQFDKLVQRLEEQPLEEKIDLMDQHLEPIKQFILPGGTTSSSQVHVCRSVCRRAEREVVRVIGSIDVSEEIKQGLMQVMKYLNRLSDYFFVLARYLNKLDDVSDIFWSQE